MIPRVILIVVAIGIAGLTAYLVNNYLSKKEQEITESGKAQQGNLVKTAEVLVAERDLGAGTIVTLEHLRWQEWPETGINENYYSRGGKFKEQELVGYAVKRAISAGEPVSKSKLLAPGEAGFLAGVLAPGKRAISMQVSAVTGAAGFILPDNRVDLILTQEYQAQTPTGATVRKIIGETILENVRVLAIDQTVDDAQSQTRLGKTITFEVTPEEAEAITVAKQMGKISLALRSLTADPPDLIRQANFTSDDQVSKFLSRDTSIAPRILVAGRPLPAGTLLRDTDIEWQVQTQDVDVSGFVIEANTQVNSLRGAYLKEDVAQGEPISEKALIRTGEQGFIIAALSPGMRAVSVAVTQVSGVSGYVSPGDRIDVLMTHDVNDTSDEPILTPRKFTETIAEDIRLLAIEQTIDGATGKPVIGQTVTVEVTSRQAEVLALGVDIGKLSMSLRSVPSLPAHNEDEEQYTSDLYVSRATVDFLVGGTARAPQLQRRAGQRRSSTSVPTTTVLPSAPSRRSSSSKTIRVYRSTQPSNVVVGK